VSGGPQARDLTCLDAGRAGATGRLAEVASRPIRKRLL